MLSTMFAVVWMDGQIAEIFRSEFVVPVAGCAMTGCIVVAGIWSGVRTREIKSQERLARIAQGLPEEPEWSQEAMQQASSQGVPAAKPFGAPSNGAGARRAGVVLSSIGVGLIVFFAFLAIVLRERDVFSGASAGILPLIIGIGFFIDARHRRQDYDRWMENVRLHVPGFSHPGTGVPAQGATAVDATMPPPPPPGMSAAQASDWRPLH